MNTVSGSDRTLRLAPFVLRLGLAAILIHSGVSQIAPIFTPESGQSLATDAGGVAIQADWTTVAGVGQCLVGAMFLVGLFTRLTSFAVLGFIGYAAFASAGQADEGTLNAAGQMFTDASVPMLLLAAACGSLLVSGAGCAGLDGRRRRNVIPTDSDALM